MTKERFDELFNRATAHGWLSRDEAWMLVTYAERTVGNIVEVGSYMGRSAMILAGLGRPLYCVDPWDDQFSSDYPGDTIYAQFLENVGSIPECEHVYGIRKRVEDWTPIEAGFVYLDGDHTYRGTKAQIEKALDCSPQIIAIHDYSEVGGGAEIKRAADKLLGQYHMRCDRLAVYLTGG